MVEFLRQVADHYFDEGSLQSDSFIFPNRRSTVFFRKYLADAASASGVPVISPQCLTMNEFFQILSGKDCADHIALILELYRCYCPLVSRAEPLDEFIGWGEIILSDFGDVDKYLVDADKLFANVSDFKKLDTTLEYLSETQREALEKFARHFRGEAGDFKKRFLHTWEVLYPLYMSFSKSLSDKGLAYEGGIYRAVAKAFTDESAVDVLARTFGEGRRYVFVGLNALNECEKRVMSRMRDARVAEFCWDYSSEQIRSVDNRSSFFMRENVAAFPQAFDFDTDGLVTPEINVLSVPSSTGQAKQLESVFRELKDGVPGIDTAVVLPDEDMLLPVLNSLPPSVGKVNVTMGYPMRGSGLWSLMNGLAALQTHIRTKDGRRYFYFRQVGGVLSEGILRSVMTEDDARVAGAVTSGGSYYVDCLNFADSPLLSKVFKPVVDDMSAASAVQIEGIADYQREVLEEIAVRLKDVEGMALELDFVMTYHQAVRKLRNFGLEILPSTYFRLLDSLTGRSSVPFLGEPLDGLQIMGPLETRALDFENIVILSAIEGVFPRRSIGESFIPPELRRGFGLPTYEYQDAVWAYYFYRLIQRASRVWMLVDSRTGGLNTGEESRYVKQLEMHFGVPIRRRTLLQSVVASAGSEDSIPKTEEDLAVLRSTNMSASALVAYRQCGVKFYLKMVRKLRKPDEAVESLDASMIGNVYHKVMSLLYPKGTVTRSMLESVGGEQIRRMVRKAVLEELHAFEVSGRNLVFEDMVCRYVKKTVEYDAGLLDSMGRDSFEMIGAERKVSCTMRGFKFVGRIDRIDSFSDGVARIVDYKTGSVSVKDDVAWEGEAMGKIALQMFIYDYMAGEDADLRRELGDRSLSNSVYPAASLFVGETCDIDAGGEFMDTMRGKVEACLDEIADINKPFTRNTSNCKHCDFKNICGR